MAKMAILSLRKKTDMPLYNIVFYVVLTTLFAIANVFFYYQIKYYGLSDKSVTATWACIGALVWAPVIYMLLSDEGVYRSEPALEWYNMFVILLIPQGIAWFREAIKVRSKIQVRKDYVKAEQDRRDELNRLYRLEHDK